jgi:proteic killer suppression protein
LALVTSRVTMIKSFGNKSTERIWNGFYNRAFSLEIQEIARRKLRMLNSSADIIDLRVPPSNKLEKLKGNLKEYYSIRVNNQWRIIFKWHENNAYQVELIDYHK